MNKTRYLLFFLLILSIACQIVPTPPALKRTPSSYILDSSITPGQINGEKGTATISQLPSTSTIVPGDLPAFPFVSEVPFSNIDKYRWSPPENSIERIELPINLDQAINSTVVSGLTSQQRHFLENNGFVVIQSNESDFASIRKRVSYQFGQPYFLTSDAAYQALKLSYLELICNLEKEELHPRIISILKTTLDEILSYASNISGTELENDTQTAIFFLEVALKLLDQQYISNTNLADLVNRQVSLIIAGNAPETQIEFPIFVEDYQAFIPKGHYQGDQKLESYFRGLTWLNLIQFKFEVADSSINATRSPLIITLAMRRAKLQNKTVAEEWMEIQKILNFFFGAGYFSGPPEYSHIMDQIYGSGLTIIGLQDESRWQAFQSISLNMLPYSDQTQISPLNQNHRQALNWTFFSFGRGLDKLIIEESLNKQQPTITYTQKVNQFTSGLEFMALLGSQTALDTLSLNQNLVQETFLSEHENFIESIQSQTDSSWLSDFHSAWLFSITQFISTKNYSYPSFMRTKAWEYKDLNSALGAWVNLQYDGELTWVRSNEQVSIKYPSPCYIEPNPEIFFRLSYIAIAIADGLEQRISISNNSQNNSLTNQSIIIFKELGLRYQQLGDIAAKQLSGLELDENDRIICLSPLYPISTESSDNSNLDTGIEIINSINGSSKDILQMGIGHLDRIYAVMPFGEEITIAQGGIFSYYEFPWRKEETLSVSEWKNLLKYSHPERPQWTEAYLFQDGYPIDVLAFRVGDAYKITLSGKNLNLREEPSSVSPSITRMQPGEIVEIIDGPIEVRGEIWWKFKITVSEDEFIQGWAIEEQDFYERIIY